MTGMPRGTMYETVSAYLSLYDHEPNLPIVLVLYYIMHVSKSWLSLQGELAYPEMSPRSRPILRMGCLSRSCT